MILDALIVQFRQRFQHEKRAQVCLWVDEKGEFALLLPQLREHLSAMVPPPFVLLEYDPDAYHGQIWLKHRVYTDLAALGPEEQKRQHYVFYLPLSEDRLEAPDDDGAHHLELPAEYRVTGVLWRLAGERPTLFSFLRQTGVKLPDNPSEQRRLYDGGRNSLLAKYMAKFVKQPSAFWNTLLTPEVAQSRLIGDVEQTILDLGVSPETTWQALQDKGLTYELVDMVRERYGFEAPTGNPALWIRMFVETLALTETYLGYNEPVDFPFAGMKEAIKTADAYLKANVRNLGIDRDLKGYDFSIQAINLNQAKEGAETAVAFFISMVSAILDKPVLDRTVVLGEMSVQGMLLRVHTLPERMQLAVEAGAKRILIPSENKRDLADVPDAILTAIQWQFYDAPTKAAIIATGMN